MRTLIILALCLWAFPAWAQTVGVSQWKKTAEPDGTRMVEFVIDGHPFVIRGYVPFSLAPTNPMPSPPVPGDNLVAWFNARPKVDREDWKKQAVGGVSIPTEGWHALTAKASALPVEFRAALLALMDAANAKIVALGGTPIIPDDVKAAYKARKNAL